ncbi:putative NADH-ubiquinone oxidoreductase 18 kDa subunit [Xylariaceae sp. FL0255]|nr:putative NADH-ubiquinone oxidoreductase 18 kDa subunit [Xylariaceae sp. FL0255]
MVSLRTQSAARILRASHPVASRPALATAARRFKSDQASSTTAVDTTRPANSPDYGVHIDRATSTFTPVPKRVMDGSEDTDILPAAVLSGAPIELQARTVRIYQPSKPATQSGTWGSHHWRMDWDILGKGHRWENPLMGWQSSGDFMQGTKIEFKTKEDAIRFAEKQGYEYFVQEPKQRSFTPKAYANNFLYSPKKLKLVRAK